MKPQLFRDRHPRPHHKDAAVHTQVDAACGKVGFDELATNGIQLYDVAKYGVGGALVAWASAAWSTRLGRLGAMNLGDVVHMQNSLPAPHWQARLTISLSA